jgi:membrane-associated phospholipid phosphatase
MQSKAKAFWIWFVVTVIAVAIAGMLDARVAMFARDCGAEGFLDGHKMLREILKAPGFFGFTVVVVIPLVIWRHRMRWRAGIFIFVATVLSGSNQLIKWVAGRTRPFKLADGSGRLAPFELHPFPHDGKNLCFPSGHADLAFATAAGLGILWPRFRWGFYAVALVVAIERIAENAHWLSDVVAATALGVGGAYLVRWVMGDILSGGSPFGSPLNGDD